VGTVKGIFRVYNQEDEDERKAEIRKIIEGFESKIKTIYEKQVKDKDYNFNFRALQVTEKTNVADIMKTLGEFKLLLQEAGLAKL
jgi:hypothetical protein